MNNRIQRLMASSSSMGKLEQERVVYWQITQGFNQERREEDRFHLEFFPQRQIIQLEKVKVLFEAQIWSLGTAPRWVAEANIMFFANEAHRCEWLGQCGFSTEWIDSHLLPQEAEVIPFPTQHPWHQIARKTRLPRPGIPMPYWQVPNQVPEVAIRKIGQPSPG